MLAVLGVFCFEGLGTDMSPVICIILFRPTRPGGVLSQIYSTGEGERQSRRQTAVWSEWFMRLGKVMVMLIIITTTSVRLFFS